MYHKEIRWFQAKSLVETIIDFEVRRTVYMYFPEECMLWRGKWNSLLTESILF